MVFSPKSHPYQAVSTDGYNEKLSPARMAHLWDQLAC